MISVKTDTNINLFNKFIDDVKTHNPKRYGKNAKYAVDRHINDLRRSKKKDFQYYFDEAEAARIIGILKRLRHTKGSFAGKLFDVQPHQAFTFGSLFGWRKKKNKKLRRFRKMYKATAKKSGKSEEMAALEIIFNFFDGEIGAEVYTVATKRDQANHVFKAARRMCMYMRKESKMMRRRIKLRQYDILDTTTESVISRLTSDSESEDGASPSCSVVDEFHAHKDSSTLKGMELGALERENSLTAIITTAGFNKNYPCYKLQKTVCEPILRGDIENDEFFILIFDLDEDDDPHKEINWYKANPNLGNTPKIEAFRSLYKNAKLEGETAWVSFLTKCLNKWCDTPSIWIPSEDWKACGNSKLDIQDFKGYQTYIGLDLSTRKDISALYILIPPQKDLKKFVAIGRFYCPESKISGIKNIDEVDYRQWAKNEHITVTTTKRGIDYDFIKSEILKINEITDLQIVSCDPYNSENLLDELENENDINCLEWKQTASWMHTPTKKLELMVLDEEIIHDNNPCMNWMMGNVVIMTDSNNNMKIDKKKSINKVDGPVALVNAIGGYFTIEAEGGTIDVDNLGELGAEPETETETELITAEDL